MRRGARSRSHEPHAGVAEAGERDLDGVTLLEISGADEDF